MALNAEQVLGRAAGYPPNDGAKLTGMPTSSEARGGGEPPEASGPREEASAGETERLRHIWSALQELMEDEDFRGKAKTALKRLEAERQAASVPKAPCGASLEAEELGAPLRARIPSLTLQNAVALQSELFQRYSQPDFQAKLFSAYCGNGPRSPAYSEKLTALLRSARADVLAQYGLPAGQDGDLSLALALSEFHANPDVQALTSSIDDILYSGEALMVQNSTGLTKREVLVFCRGQLALFRTPDFQHRLSQLKAANRSCEHDDCFRLEGREQLALAELKPLLAKHGKEPNMRGLHSILQQFAQYIMDPEVAAHGEAINTLLGMEPEARARFTARLRTIAAEAPGPTVAKTALTPQRRRHSWGSGERAQIQTGQARRRSLGGFESAHTGAGASAPVQVRRRRSLVEALALPGDVRRPSAVSAQPDPMLRRRRSI